MRFYEIDNKYLNWEYVPENADEGEVYTWDDVVDIANGNVRLAQIIVDLCDWQFPETVLDELIREEEVIEVNDRYILVPYFNR